MRIGTVLTITLAVILAATATAGARTWRILPDGSGDAATIQAGIDSAAAGDCVVLSAGTYTGVGNRSIDFLGKAITVTSKDGRDVTIIDCQGLGFGFAFHSGEGTSSVLSDVTIRNSTYVSPGAIRCEYSSPTISNNTIAGNYSTGIYCSGDYISPTISYNIITGNSNLYWAGGGGIHCSGAYSSPTISHNIITGNSALEMGGGIYCNNFCQAIIRYNTISGNSAPFGGGICLMLWSNVYITNTIISFSSQGEAVFCDKSGATLKCCDVYGNAGGDWGPCIAYQLGLNGNFSADPKFCHRWDGDYCIDYSSPCTPGNNPYGYDCGLIGASGVGCERPTGIQPTTWGRIKTMFR